MRLKSCSEDILFKYLYTVVQPDGISCNMDKAFNCMGFVVPLEQLDNFSPFTKREFILFLTVGFVLGNIIALVLTNMVMGVGVGMLAVLVRDRLRRSTR